MKKFIVLFIFLIQFVTYLSFAQTSEVCNNGIDDDGDGFIDCYDKKCVTSTFCKDFYLGEDPLCEVAPPAFPKFTMQTDFVTPDETTNHLGRVVVGDIDGDKIPEMVTVNRFAKKIVVLNGQGGAVKNSVATSFSPGYEEIAIANVDPANGSCAEIFIIDTNWNLYMYDCNLTQKWGPVKLLGDPGMYGLADFDGNGTVELYVRDAIYDALTGNVLVATKAPDKTTWETKMNGGPVAVDIVNHPTDPAKNDQLELVQGCKIYSVDLAGGTLNLVKELPEYFVRSAWNATSIADYNQDNYLDVIASGSTIDHGKNTTIFFWDVQNNTYKTFEASVLPTDPDYTSSYTNGWAQGTGRINIADLDGNEKLNVSFVSGKFLFALDENLNLFWRKVVNEETSGYTGCTLFDFNGDGESEIVYRDEKFLYILKGSDGSIYSQQTCVSRTNREYPVVADVDADGQTELCVTCRTTDFFPGTDANGKSLDVIDFSTIQRSQYSQVRVFRTAADPWVPARRVWNQHGYFNVNVNDDLTIPIKQQKHHLIFSTGSCTQGPNRPLNSFLNQSPFLNIDGCPMYKSPDLSVVQNSLKVSPPTCPNKDFKISFDFTNKGDIGLSGNLPVTFYNGDPRQAGAVKLNTVTIALNNFDVGSVHNVLNASVSGPGSAFTLYIVLNDAGTTSPLALPNTSFFECDYSNNILSGPVLPLPVHVVGEKLSDNIICDVSTGKNNGSVTAYVPIGSTKNTTDYIFYWSDGTTAKAIPADHAGASYTGLPTNTYTVFAVHKTANCNSDTAKVIVNETVSVFTVNVEVLNNLTTCSATADGSLKAIVKDKNGNVVANPEQKYDFEWYVGDDYLTGLLIPGGETVGSLKASTYTVRVIEKSSGCFAIKSADVSDETSGPPITSADIAVNDISCSVSSTGEVKISNPLPGVTYKWYNGQTAKPSADFTGTTYSNIPKGFYTVVATNNTSNCSSATVTVEVKQTTPPVITGIVKDSDQASCDSGNLLGAATVSVQGNINDYDFQWYKGQSTAAANAVAGKTSASATGLEATTYTVKVTHKVTQCFSTKEIKINGPAAVTLISVVPTAKSNCIPNNSKIEVLTLSSGTPGDYDFFWYIGSSEKATSDFPSNKTNILAGVEPDNYTVKAVHKITKCATPAQTVKIDNNVPAITFNNTSIPPNDCGSPTGSITTNTTPNILGYDFTWYEGGAAIGTPINTGVTNTASSSTIASIPDGYYTVEILNKDTGCKIQNPYYLGLINAHKLNFLSKEDIYWCTQPTPLTPGGSLTSQLVPTVGNISDYEVLFFQGSIDPGKTDASKDALGAVVSPGAFPNDDVFKATSTLSGFIVTPGYYTMVAIPRTTGTSIDNKCRVPVTVLIEQKTHDPEIDGNATATGIISNSNCKTDVVANQGNGAIDLALNIPVGFNTSHYTYTWSNGDVTQDISNLKPGSYSVKVEFTNTAPSNQGCFTTRTFDVLDNQKQLSADIANGDLLVSDITTCDPADGKTLSPLGSAIFKKIIVDDGASEVTDFSTYSFIWSKRSADGSLTVVPDDDPTKEEDIANLNAGSYQAFVTDNVSHCDLSADFTVMDGTINSVFASLDNFVLPSKCLNPNVSGLLEVSASGTSTMGYTYSWYEGTISGGNLPANPLGTTVGTTAGPDGNIAQNLTPGNYAIKVVNNENNCWAIDSYELQLNTVPVVISAYAAPLTICFVNQEDGVVFASSVNANHINYNFNWWILDNSVGLIPDFTGREVTGLKDGEYKVEVVDKNDAGCSATTTVKVIDLRAYPTVVATSLAPLTNCDPAKPDGVANASVDGQIINHEFTWYQGATPSGASFYTGAEVSGLSAATISVIASDIFTGCSDSTNVTIEMNQLNIPSPTIEVLSMVTSCVEDNGALSVSVDGNTSDYIFDWYIGTVEKLSADFVGDIYDSLAVGIYSVTATSRETGCKSPLTSEEIIADPLYPDFNFEIGTATCEMDNGFVSLFVTNEIQVDKIEWTSNRGPVLGPLLNEVPAGIYSVTVTSLLGCATTKEVEIKTDIHVFNGVSRNGDGANDIFHINCIENFPTNLVKIFNRAGTLVYEAEGYDNIDIYFDGKSNKGISMMGTNLPDGTYFYIVDKRDGTKPRAGYLEIVN